MVFEASARSGRTREAISTRTCEEIFTICMRNQVPCGRFLEGQQVFDDPQVRHNGTIVPQQHRVGGRFVTDTEAAGCVSRHAERDWGTGAAAGDR